MRDLLRIFISGRVAALVILLTFQIVVVRALPVPEYAKYSFVFGVMYFVQATTSFGIPRLISKYISQADLKLTNRAVRGFALWIIAFRVGTCILVLLLILVTAVIIAPSQIASQRGLMAPSVIYICVSALLFDADSMTQALMLQHDSRRNALGEPLIRLALIIAMSGLGVANSAAGVLAISAATGAASLGLLWYSVFKRLGQTDKSARLASNPDKSEVWSVGVGGYASSLAWFASSPAIVRLLASTMLTVRNFAGFGFVQSLFVSLQRYTPGQMLYPFIEPAIMGESVRTTDRSRLQSALSLVTKVDAACIGALVVGTAIGGTALVDIMTNGKYGGAAVFLPWLLLLIVGNSLYRSYEIAAVALGAAGALTRAMPFSLVWLGALAYLGPRFGVWPLLLCPIGDVVTRLYIVERSLRRLGVASIVDFPVLALIGALVLCTSLLGQQMVRVLSLSGAMSIAAGGAFAVILIASLFLLRPLRGTERQIIARQDTRLHRLLAQLVR